MPLRNFGSIMNFAAELESADKAFYIAASKNPGCSRYKEMFEEFARDADKNLKLLLRARQENVTEMVLENIENFMRDPFISSRDNPDHLNLEEVLERIEGLQAKALLFYNGAAEKLQALPEVSRILRMIGKKRKACQEKIMEKKINQ